MERGLEAEKLLGGTGAQRADIVEKLTRMRAERTEDAQIEKREFEPSPRDREIFSLALKAVQDAARKYGGKRYTFPLEKVRWLPMGAVRDITNGELAGGIAWPISREVAVERSKSDFALAIKLAHEIAHQLGYTSMQILKDGSTVPYRRGLESVSTDGKIAFFDGLEEAFVVELTRKMQETLGEDELLKQEYIATKKVKDWMQATAKMLDITNVDGKIDNIVAFEDPRALLRIFQGIRSLEAKMRMFKSAINDAFYFDEVHEDGYEEERKLFHSTLERAVALSHGEVTREQVFDLFGRAHFSGEYLPLARTVDKYLGAGTFRALGERTARRVDV